MDRNVERVVDLLDPELNRLHGMTLEEARRRVLEGSSRDVREIDGSFAIVAKRGEIVRMARSLDRPMRYFLAKRQAGPVLVVAHRMDAIRDWLVSQGLGKQFHPSYTRMVPAHHVVELHLVGCPDPEPTYVRFFAPPQGVLPADPAMAGKEYIGALAREISRWLAALPKGAPIGVCFSGGIDSGAVFLVTYYVMKKSGMNLGRLKAFTLDLGEGADLVQARRFLQALDLELFLEPVEGSLDELDVLEVLRVVEDYKPLDLECASMVLALCKGIRARYPDWRFLLDGDGGDENLKDYPIEENPELTIQSVLGNSMLYQEGWGVGKIKHSLTYSGGLSRSCTRVYAPLRMLGFQGFSPFTRPALIEVAEAIPFVGLTNYDHGDLYRLKGEIVLHGIRALTGLEMPIYPKRRFQHGAVQAQRLRRIFPETADYRQKFYALWS